MNLPNNRRKYKLLEDIKLPQGNLKKGEIGEGLCLQGGIVVVWFTKHQREFYWYPITLDMTQVKEMFG